MYLLEEDLKFPKDSFKSMKHQPYEMKPSFSMVRVYQWWNYWYGEVYISFSGGLDSTVLAYIVCQAYRKYKLTGKIPLVFADTGTEFPEIREFVKTYTEWLKEQFPELDIELVVIRPKHSFKWVCENKGFPITSKDTAGKIRKLRHGKLSEKYRNYLLNGDKRGKFGMLAKKWQYLTDTEQMPADISEYCCEALKKEPFKRYVKETGRQPFIGITQDESFRRENQYNHTGCNVYDGHTIKSQPMGFWPKNEVIQYAVEQRIPVCSKRQNNRKIRRAYMDKYLSIITNFGCHGRCPYCIVRENGIKVPKSTIGGLDKLEDAIKMTGANIVSISGGGDPLYRYSDNPLVPMYLGMVMGICIKAGIPMEMHTSYTESEFPYHFCKRVVHHLQSVEDLENVVRRGAEIVRVVFVATEKLSREEINRISDFVRCSDQIDELSFRQMVNDRYETEYYNDDFLKAGHNKGLWHYIRQKDYNIYYAENRIYTKFSEIEADIQEER